jgi:segregation and condensation protein B
MERELDIKPLVEALLFASGEPISVTQLHDLIPGSTPQKIREALSDLKSEYEQTKRSFTLEEIAGGVQLLTRPEYHEWVQRLHSLRRESRLTPAALEVLSIIAYKQPVRRAEVEAIRGVQCGPILRGLMEKRLIRISGRANLPGAPLLYSTTSRFLELFHLKSLQELPRLEELRPEPSREG